MKHQESHGFCKVLAVETSTGHVSFLVASAEGVCILLTYCIWVNFSTIISWMSPFVI